MCLQFLASKFKIAINFLTVYCHAFAGRVLPLERNYTFYVTLLNSSAAKKDIPSIKSDFCQKEIWLATMAFNF